MLAICDGGSTKADWIIRTADGRLIPVTTPGFNPNYDSVERISSIVRHELADKLDENLCGSVYYYGAGCGEPDRISIVEQALSAVFSRASIAVKSDLLGAARATCGEKPGITCILGTGSNSVLYDGQQEADHVTNLGFLLGDEGSGAQIGKRLVQAYFYREMPPELHPVMRKVCPNGRQDMLSKVYGGGVPAAFLASFVRLFADQHDHPFVQQIVKDCFREFLLRHVCKYENHEMLPVHFVGSVAWFFKDTLNETLNEMHLHKGVVLRRPIENLCKYHLQTEKQNQAGPEKDSLE